jgi:hypothetical protein
MSADPLPLAGAAKRIRGTPGRPRKPESIPASSESGRPQRLHDLEASALYLGVSIWSVRDLEAQGILRRVRIPLPGGREFRKVLFDVRDLDALIERWKDHPD